LLGRLRDRGRQWLALRQLATALPRQEVHQQAVQLIATAVQAFAA